MLPRQYDECIALLDMIHRLLFYGDSSCVDSVLNYIPEQLWIGSYRVVMESLLSAESSFGKDASEYVHAILLYDSQRMIGI